MAVDPSHVNPLHCTAVTPHCPVEASIYGYYPNFACNAFFVALFGFCLFVNFFFGVRYRTWTYMLAMCLACLSSAIGYAGRVMMRNNPYNMTGFQVQICCLTLSPAFNSAAIYLILKHVVRCFGREWSRIRPKYYTWGFITADFLALVLQAVGGAMAATAGDDDGKRDIGDRLMISGISWQVLTLLIFGIMINDYSIRRLLSKTPLSPQAKMTINDIKFRIFAISLVLTYFSVFTRCVYRIAEMSGGWRNPIMQNQDLFIGADSRYVSL